MQERHREAATTLTSIHHRSASLPSLKIVATAADGTILEIPLGLAPIHVGTAPDCDLIVKDPSVSRHHCVISITSKGVRVSDRESKNGTFIGGTEIREAYLTDGAAARVGGTSIRLHVVGAPREIPLWAGARFGEVLGGSIVMRALFQSLHQAALSQETILLTGESGTGKELLARAVHDASPRKEGPFVIFDAGAVAEGVLESELFGHVRGAFTGATTDRTGLFAEADGGTLVLDEVGELPLSLQPKLLRVLESRTYRPVGATDWRKADVRIVAATHRDLRAAVTAGTFREDLYYRLAVIEARVPPLRERKEDIELLVERFLAAENPPRTIHDLPPTTMEMLLRHDWPGNVRELRNTVSRLAVFPDLADAAIDHAGTEGEVRAQFNPLLALPWRDARERINDRFEAIYVAAKLREHGGNVAQTAAQMGVSRQLVYRLIERHNLAATTTGSEP